jgi:hypothetical protein
MFDPFDNLSTSLLPILTTLPALPTLVYNRGEDKVVDFIFFCTVEELQFCRNRLICRKNMGLMGEGNELDQ